MFESEIRIETDRLLRLLENEQPYLPLEALQQDERIEPPYRQFFSAEVEWWIYQQQLQRRRSPYFDFQQPAFQPLLEQYDAFCRKFARFDQQTRRDLAALAAKVRCNFLVRPQTTLRWFVFRGEPTQPAEVIFLRLQYFGDYPYLVRGVQQAVEEQTHSPEQLLSALDFERIIQRVDQDELFDYTPTQFLELLIPMEQFFQTIYGFAGRTGISGIPIAALIVFLHDKGIFPIAEKLQEIAERQHKEFISREEFRYVIQLVLEQVEQEQEETLPLEFAPAPPQDSVAETSISETVPAEKEAEALLAEQEDDGSQEERKEGAEVEEALEVSETSPVSEGIETAPPGAGTIVELSVDHPEAEQSPQESTLQQEAMAPEQETSEPERVTEPVSAEQTTERGDGEKMLEAVSDEEAEVTSMAPPEETADAEQIAESGAEQLSSRTEVEEEAMQDEATEGAATLADTEESDVEKPIPEDDGITDVAVQEEIMKEIAQKDEEYLPLEANEEIMKEIAQKDEEYLPPEIDEADTTVEDDQEAPPMEYYDVEEALVKSETAPVADVELQPFKISERAQRVRDFYFELLGRSVAPEAAEDACPIQSCLDVQEQERMIEELCQGDADLWQAVVDRINRHRTWKEAVAEFDRIVVEQRWDPDHPLVQRLRQALYARFVQPADRAEDER